MLQDILTAVTQCANRGTDPLDFWIRKQPFDQEESHEHNHFLFMMKPELLQVQHGVDVQAILALITRTLQEHAIAIRSVRVLSSTYLKVQSVMEKHYGMLNQISRLGLSAVSEAAVHRLQQTFPHLRISEDSILGGHQFLQRTPEFSPFALEVLTRNVETVKLGAGTYAIHVEIDGKPLVILNPFHPCQVEWFTSPGQSVVVFECTSTRHLLDIRRNTLGATDPTEAAPGSIKRMLLDRQAEFRLPSVCTRFNGVHLSPSVVEGMVALTRYFSDEEKVWELQETSFGQQLLAHGLSERQLAWLSTDPEVVAGDRSGPIFEVTEDVNWDEALRLVTSLPELR